MLSLHTPTTPGMGSKGHFFLLKVFMLHIKLKWKKCRPTLNLHTPLTSGVGFKGHISKLCRCKYIFFIKLSTKTYLTGICYDLNNTEGELRAR